MKLVFRENFSYDGRTLVRRCGYGEIYDRQTDQISYVRRLRSEHYPRFHLYINKEETEELVLNLHLDAKKPSYSGQTAHSGEYDGEVVEREAERIKEILAGYINR